VRHAHDVAIRLPSIRSSYERPITIVVIGQATRMCQVVRFQSPTSGLLGYPEHTKKFGDVALFWLRELNDFPMFSSSDPR
jgi:hypothetical protein